MTEELKTPKSARTTYNRVILLADSASLPDSKTADKEAIYLVPEENKHKQKTVTAYQFKDSDKEPITILEERLQSLTSEKLVFPSSASETREDPDLANRLVSTCWSINPTQLYVLHEAIAPKEIYQTKGEDDEGGYSFDYIRKHTAIDVGTKILYLERAITLAPSAFHHYLDKLDNPNLTEARKDNFEFIKSLKRINDLYWNAQESEDNGKALDILFKNTNPTCSLRECQAEITHLIQQGISSLKSEHPQEWAQQRAHRLVVEKDMEPSYAWRLAAHMPSSQLPSHLAAFTKDTVGSTLYRGGESDNKSSRADLCVFAEKYHEAVKSAINGTNNDSKTTILPSQIANLCAYIANNREIINTLIRGSDGRGKRLTIADIFLLEYGTPGSFQRTLDFYQENKKNLLAGTLIHFPQLFDTYKDFMPSSTEDIKSKSSTLSPPVVSDPPDEVKSKPLTLSLEDSQSYESAPITLTQEEQEEITALSMSLDIPLADLEKPKKPPTPASILAPNPIPPPAPLANSDLIPGPHPAQYAHSEYVFFKKPSRQQKVEAAVVSIVSGACQVASLGLLWRFDKDWMTTVPDASSVGNLMNNAAAVYSVLTLATLLVATGILSVRREAQDAEGHGAQPQ